MYKTTNNNKNNYFTTFTQILLFYPVASWVPYPSSSRTHPLGRDGSGLFGAKKERLRKGRTLRAILAIKFYDPQCTVQSVNKVAAATFDVDLIFIHLIRI